MRHWLLLSVKDTSGVQSRKRTRLRWIIYLQTESMNCCQSSSCIWGHLLFIQVSKSWPIYFFAKFRHETNAFAIMSRAPCLTLFIASSPTSLLNRYWLNSLLKSSSLMLLCSSILRFVHVIFTLWRTIRPIVVLYILAAWTGLTGKPRSWTCVTTNVYWLAFSKANAVCPSDS